MKAARFHPLRPAPAPGLPRLSRRPLPGHWTLRLPGLPVSFHPSRRSVVATAALLAVTVAAFTGSLCLGSLAIPPQRVVAALLDGLGGASAAGVGTGGGAAATAAAGPEAFVVQNLRLPRALVAVLAGAALGLAGALTQAVFRNPLAAPDILGVTGGASAAAVAFLTYGEGLSIRWLPPAAFAGAMVTALAMHALARRTGASLRLILVGIGLRAATAALTTLFVVKSPIYLTNRAMLWLTGTVYGATWTDALLLAPWLLGAGGLTLAAARRINALQLGDAVAGGLGTRPDRDRVLALAAAAALTGAAVAVAGAVGFVALLAPHIARFLAGPAFSQGGLAAALTGGLMLLAADTLGRVAFPPLDVPAGVFTAAVGAPFFLLLLYRQQRG
ncbi:FecCD family ABC transporter permease [Thermaerobacter subterraneus]|uniref:ABC-type Fe3+-siderophore transport system, permease component n=1 Tax=Thermaerobacter subterraneus DSM 13965 TaxID=867903 RepID=K6Q0K6_9FIRM|nr:iron ABC transporter permease [Thermaerobacter subterraneus]EKP94439.1 ABC-type Fe3+-siderophore transport system, permease component [Thermaerobacter subterraneus DSM 13965]